MAEEETDLEVLLTDEERFEPPAKFAEQANVVAVMVVAQAIQVVLFTAGLFAFFLALGVIAIPALYYHFVLIFLDATTRHRPSLVAAYALAFVYSLINLSGTPLFMKGVKMTYWGWAPDTGPLYLPYLVARARKTRTLANECEARQAAVHAGLPGDV